MGASPAPHLSPEAGASWVPSVADGALQELRSPSAREHPSVDTSSLPMPPATPEPTASDRQTAPAAGALNCFLVEDSAIIRENLVATLQEMLDVDVVGQAEDEAGALRWLHDEAVPCDIVIIDIFLKRGTGLSLLPKARLLQPEAKLVILSNYATVDMRRRCEQLGADRVFDKSSELDELIAYCLDLAAAKA